MQNNTKAQDVGALWNIIYMHLHVVFTYQATFYSQIFSQHIFRLNFQTYCIRSTQDSEPVKDAKKCPIINQSENKMPTSSQSHVTDLISFLTHIWHEQLEWFHYLQYLCQDRCFRQPWTKMEKTMCPKWERQKSNDNLEQNWCLGHFGSWLLIFHSIQNVLDLLELYL